MDLPNISERVSSALEVAAVVLLQLADAALLGLHPAVRAVGAERAVRALRLRLLTLPRCPGSPGATLTGLVRLPSRGRYAYLYRRWTPKTTLLPGTPR